MGKFVTVLFSGATLAIIFVYGVIVPTVQFGTQVLECKLYNHYKKNAKANKQKTHKQNNKVRTG